MTTRTYSGFRMLGLLVLALLLTSPAIAQIVAEAPFTAFPTASQADGRFLTVVSGLSGLTATPTSVGISVPPDRTRFTFRIFDGDTGEPCDPSSDSTCSDPSQGHWDEGTAPVCATMYADPLRTGEATSTVIGRWCGNRDNPTSGMNWTADPRMLNNKWWSVRVEKSAAAVAPSGEAFYLVIFELDALSDDDESVNNFKVSANVPLSVFSSSFGFEAGIIPLNNGRSIIYPTIPFPVPFPVQPDIFTSAPTTYDGSYSFYLDIREELTTLTLWDGDMDYGTTNRFSLLGVPSGEPFAACADTDDANSEGIPSFAQFPGTAAKAEAAKGPGEPTDNNRLDQFRRGGCITYTLTDPNGTVYLNQNPSGDQEWEKFVITTAPVGEDQADYSPVFAADGATFVDGDFLPVGLWRVDVIGLDLSNSVFWRFEQTVCGNFDGQPQCPEEPVLIGDRVWYDLDGDTVGGDALNNTDGEPGIQGVKVNRAGTRRSTVTNAEGVYRFDVPPGTESDPKQYTVELAEENFTVVPKGALGDRVWLDLDADGVQDDDEPGLANVRVRLLDCTLGLGNPGTVLAAKLTDQNGVYWFSGLESGIYCTQVRPATLPTGLVQTGDPDGVFDNRALASIDVFGNPSVKTLDYGYWVADQALAAIGDRVWVDLDEDGEQDESEPGLAGATITLYDCTGLFVGRTTTDAAGFYSFGELTPDCYEVVVDPLTLLPGYYQTYDLDGLGTPDRASAVVNAGEFRIDVDFGYVGLDRDLNGKRDFCLADVFWFDADANGLFDGDDYAIPGVTVTIRSLDGEAVLSTVSGSDGRFEVCGLRRQPYRIDVDDRFGALSGLVGTTQAGVDGRLRVSVPTIVEEPAGSGQFFAIDYEGTSFGYVQQGRLANCVFTSPDPLAPITGEIQFDAAGLPMNNLEFDFGCRPQGSIGDRVWLDENGDGVQDAGEAGLADVAVELYTCSGDLITETTTGDGSVDVNGDGVADASDVGYYLFGELAPGCYEVVIPNAPAGTVESYDLDSGTVNPDGRTVVELGFNEDRDDADFGYAPFSTIGDRVWLDINGDGIQDGGEPGISGVTVELRSCSGQLLESFVTGDGTQDLNGDGFVNADDIGYYEFVDLMPGCYDVVVVASTLPMGAMQTFDLDGVLDHRTEILLGAGQNRTDADFGYQVVGQGTGTPGYWKNHAEAWPVREIYLGGVLYTLEEGIWILRQETSGDMTYVMAAHLIAAKLNVFSATDSSCIAECIASADAWLAKYPIGSGVSAESKAWKEGEKLKNKLDRYNNGRLCADGR